MTARRHVHPPPHTNTHMNIDTHAKGLPHKPLFFIRGTTTTVALDQSWRIISTANPTKAKSWCWSSTNWGIIRWKPILTTHLVTTMEACCVRMKKRTRTWRRYFGRWMRYTTSHSKPLAENMSSKSMNRLAPSDFRGPYSSRFVNVTTISTYFQGQTVFVSPVQDKPPQQHRFKDKRIPRHITYAYKRAAKIAKNEDFYHLPEGTTKTIDLLFVIANAPVGTVCLPKHGSEAYVGLATAMELAMDEISKEFPAFFVGEAEPSVQCKM